MKRILIVNNNLDMGGIQKSLINLLKAVSNDYEITLLLFYKQGSLIPKIPKTVKVIAPNKVYSVLGMTHKELKRHPLLLFIKLILKMLAKIIHRRNAMRLLGLFQKRYRGFDTVISFSHLTKENCFSNGAGDFVLDKTISSNKICMIHCDYKKSGFCSDYNNKEYGEFDKIVCCSESVKKVFVNCSNIELSRIYTLRNFYDLDIKREAAKNAYKYDNRFINVVTIARLSPEKGINRFLDALLLSKRKDIKYYIIGEGPLRYKLQEYISNNKLSKQVMLLGEKKNPYSYLVNADFLALPSLHEAAPLVFDESSLLRVPIISTNTISAKEMIVSGIISDDMEEVLLKLSKRDSIILKKGYNNIAFDNETSKMVFAEIVEDENDK